MRGRSRGVRRPTFDGTGPARARLYRTRFDAKGNRIIDLGPVVQAAPDGLRSSNGDRERLRHLSATVFNYEGIVAHLADGNDHRRPDVHPTARPGFKRPMPKVDRARLAEAVANGDDHHPSGIDPIEAWGADDLFLRPDITIEQAEANIDRALEREPRTIRNVRYIRDITLNGLAHMSPRERLDYLRSLHVSREPVSECTESPAHTT